MNDPFELARTQLAARKRATAAAHDGCGAEMAAQCTPEMAAACAQMKKSGKIARTINFHAVPGFVIAKSLNVSPATVSRSMSEIRQVLAEAGIDDLVELK